MSKRDYTQYRNDPRPQLYTPSAKVEETEPEVTVAELPMVEETKAPVTGIVVDCDRLRMRESPSPYAEVICTIERGSKLTINEDESTASFYKVCAEIGAEGYCMKQFVKIEP